MSLQKRDLDKPPKKFEEDNFNDEVERIWSVSKKNFFFFHPLLPLVLTQ